MSNYTREDILQKIKAGQNLEGENLCGLDLSHIDFGVISLQEANLRGANLQESIFLETDLRDANLSGADLRGADLHMADLSRARLNGADLSEANLHMTKLVQADLRRANLRKANLHGSDLQHANLVEADFEDALLLGSNLGGALLTVSDFRNLDLSQAINSSVKFVDRSTFETQDSSDEYEEEEAEEIRPIVDETTERLGLKFYVEQKKSQDATQVPPVKEPAQMGGFEEKHQTGKKKGKIAVIAVAVILGLVLAAGVIRRVLTGGSHTGLRLISSSADGFTEREVIRFKADSEDDGLSERLWLWIKLIDVFNQKAVFDQLTRNEDDPRIWEYEIDPHRIKSGDYRLLFGSTKDKLLPIENADRVHISVHPPKYNLTRILNARGNQSYSLHFIGSFSQTCRENPPYLLVRIGPYRMVTIRPEPVRIRMKEIKYRLDVNLNDLRKADLSENEGYFYKEYLCDRAGHKKLLYKIKSPAEFFEKLEEPVSYEEGSRLISQKFPTAILPDEKNKLAGINLFPVSDNPGFKLVDKVNESGELELIISRPANLLKQPVYLYLDHRLRWVTSEVTFKDSGRLGVHYYYGLISGGEKIIYKSNIIEIKGTGNSQELTLAIENKNEMDIYVKNRKSNTEGGDLCLTIYEYLEKCREFAKNFPQSRRTSRLIAGSFNDYDLTGIASNFDLLSQLLNKPKYGLRLTGKTFLSLLSQGDLNFEGVCLPYQDVSSLSKKPLNLKGINLMGANLSFAKLAGADLIRANLSRANLRGAILDEAVVDGHTMISLPGEYEIIGNTITKRFLKKR